MSYNKNVTIINGAEVAVVSLFSRSLLLGNVNHSDLGGVED